MTHVRSYIIIFIHFVLNCSISLINFFDVYGDISTSLVLIPIEVSL